ncbi:DUF2975 domain-containing protein [Viridibacillus sp. YIM B01967]|uniref:DUF2975 domain-containing protein n=1 Tax=Viridibacillus soli TaxID=2798301 RepID=A0ABS1H364_9BACL|nr:DUF2975 domain-containing protein [Viridibacillus soli]MBK3493837.1 DUF2975 domain-containing protein [Viridibacillus soli]
MKQGTITFLKVAIFSIGIIILALCVFWLPGLARDTAEAFPEYASLRFPVLLGLYATAIPFFLALYETLELLKYIESKNAFSDLAVISLKYIKYCAITIIILYVIGLFLLVSKNALHPGIGVIGVVIIFATLVILLFTAVLQGLLKSALELKSENDLTV